jgi:hypothetical protein
VRALRSILSGLLLLPLLGAVAPDVQTVLAAPRKQVEAADYRATGRMVRVDAGGKRTSSGVTIKAHWFPEVLRVELEITSPKEERANILLEMRPNGQNSIRIAHPGDKTPTVLPFEKWNESPFGPAWGYEDFLDPEYFWPGQTALAQTKYGARDCNVVKSTPGAGDRTHYAEIKSWLDQSIGFPVYLEKSLKGTGLVKEFTYLGLRHEGGVWSANQVEAKVRGQAGSTLLIVERGSAKANLKLGDFSPESLVKF